MTLIHILSMDDTRGFLVVRDIPSIGICLSFTLFDLKVWIYRLGYYWSTGASLMCTDYLRTIR